MTTDLLDGQHIHPHIVHAPCDASLRELLQLAEAGCSRPFAPSHVQYNADHPRQRLPSTPPRAMPLHGPFHGLVFVLPDPQRHETRPFALPFEAKQNLLPLPILLQHNHLQDIMHPLAIHNRLRPASRTRDRLFERCRHHLHGIQLTQFLRIDDETAFLKRKIEDICEYRRIRKIILQRQILVRHPLFSNNSLIIYNTTLKHKINNLFQKKDFRLFHTIHSFSKNKSNK